MELMNPESEAEYGTLLQYFVLHLLQDDNTVVPVPAFPHVWQFNGESTSLISFLSNVAKEQGICEPDMGYRW